MQRANVSRLSEPIWITVPEDPDGLELKVIPAEAWAIGSMFEGEVADRLICRLLFVGFKNYVNGDNPVENTIQNRIELLKWSPVRRAIQNQVTVINDRVGLGEGGAVSG